MSEPEQSIAHQLEELKTHTRSVLNQLTPEELAAFAQYIEEMMEERENWDEWNILTAHYLPLDLALAQYSLPIPFRVNYRIKKESWWQKVQSIFKKSEETEMDYVTFTLVTSYISSAQQEETKEGELAFEEQFVETESTVQAILQKLTPKELEEFGAHVAAVQRISGSSDEWYTIGRETLQMLAAKVLPTTPVHFTTIPPIETYTWWEKVKPLFENPEKKEMNSLTLLVIERYSTRTAGNL